MTSIPEREPNNQAEAELIVVQQRFDELGRVAWQGIINGEPVGADITEEQDALKDTANSILCDVLGKDESRTFLARYLYDEVDDRRGLKQLQLPLASMYESAHIEGKFKDVRSYPVQHPGQYKADMGFRLCALIDASRVMGWNYRNIDVFVPVGEIYLETKSEESIDRREKEAIEPLEERRV